MSATKEEAEAHALNRINANRKIMCLEELTLEQLKEKYDNTRWKRLIERELRQMSLDEWKKNR